MSKNEQKEAKTAPISANDDFKDYCGSEHLYKYSMGLFLTDGSKALADKYECYWFLDVIMSHQPKLAREEFQVWTLEKKPKDKALVRCTDGDGKLILTQAITYTDFKAEWCTMWVENKVIMLPSER